MSDDAEDLIRRLAVETPWPREAWETAADLLGENFDLMHDFVRKLASGLGESPAFAAALMVDQDRNIRLRPELVIVADNAPPDWAPDQRTLEWVAEHAADRHSEDVRTYGVGAQEDFADFAAWVRRLAEDARDGAAPEILPRT